MVSKMNIERLLLCLAVFFILEDTGFCDDPMVSSTKITRNVGDQNVFIHCSFLSDEAPAVMWSINDTVYSISTLPFPFRYDPNGLWIPILDKSLNNTIFQCLARVSESLAVKRSPQQLLIVRESADYGDVVMPGSNPAKLELFFQDTVIGDVSKLVWVLSNGDQCQPRPLKYLLEAILCHDQQLIYNWTTETLDSNVTFNIDSSDLVSDGQLLYLNLIGYTSNGSYCSSPQSRLYINTSSVEGDTTYINPYDNVTVNIPNPPGFPISVILPGKNNSECACVLYESQLNPDEDPCNGLETCSCVRNELIAFNVTLCRHEILQNLEYTLTGTNIHPSLNNSKIYFIKDTTKSCPQLDLFYDPYPQANTFVISVTTILINGESPHPPIIVEVGHSKVCYSAESPSSFPVSKFSVTIRDVTELIPFQSTMSANMSNNCTDLSSMYPTRCAPFEVTVRAKNEDGWSEPSTMKTKGPGTICDCIKEKATVSISSVEDKFQYHMQLIVSCSIRKHGTQIQENASILVDVVYEDNAAVTPQKVICDNHNHTIDINIPGDFKAKVSPKIRNYVVTALWISPDSTGSVQCTLKTFSNYSNNKYRSGLIIGLTLALFFIIIVVLILIVCAKKYHWCHHMHTYIFGKK